jgi:two-component system CheB/CheR fusion protein
VPTTKKQARSTKKKKSAIEKSLFPVVAIGASAGGIEAISNLVENTSPNLGMAYVIIQHLAPNHESILPELLERKTKMPVHQVENNMHLQPDNVYVIPPNTCMGITHTKLQLLPRVKSDGSFHSIDFFLNKLASVYKRKAIAIILSGSASDGTIGIQSIKAEGGITFAQDESAKFKRMPESAIDSGFVDFILPPAAIAKQLGAFPKIVYSFAATDRRPQIDINESQLKKIFFLLHSKRNVDFSHYKSSTINRRIIRRMVLNRTTKAEQYIKFLEKNPTEVELLYKDLLINITSFFRDPASYTTLAKKIFPALLKGRKPNDPVRIWIPACASGEEAYSTAICLFEFLKDKTVNTPIQIFATDLNEAAIEKARQGIYSKSSLENVSPQRLKKFFSKNNGGYQIIKPIRDVCIFATHDLLKHPPFSVMDVISCQNVLIYLEAQAQNKIMHSFHYALKPTGYLLLGKSESIGISTDLFELVSKGYKVYTKKNTSALRHLDFSLRPYTRSIGSNQGKHKKIKPVKEVDLERETEKLLLRRYVPASVLVNKDLEILRFRGAISKWLEPTTGKASLHLMKMVKEEIAHELRIMLNRVKKDGRAVKKEGLRLSLYENTNNLSIEVIPVKGNSRDPYFFIIFQENGVGETEKTETTKVGGKGKESNKRIASLEKQLKEARDSIKMMSEEFEATKEELQSANEEVLSSNEELQSVNEELETSKEELQSTNEELTTINEELHTRNEELLEANDYAQTIIETLHEPLIVLSADLRIKNANKAFYKTFLVSPDETEGNYFYNLGNQQWNIPDLRRQLTLVQTKNIDLSNYKVTQNFPVIGHKIMLLNAQKLVVKGGRSDLILLAIEDITERDQAAEALKSKEERFRLLVQNAFDIITILSKDGVITYESDSVKRLLGYDPDERVGKNIFRDTIVHPEDLEKKITGFKKALSHSSELVKAEFRLKHKDGSYRDIEAVYRNLLDDPRIEGIVANYHDITEQRKLEQQREEFISIASHELRTPVTSIKGYIQILQDIFSSTGDSMSAELTGKLHLQIDKLTNLIKDLLDITQLRQGQLEFRESSFDINTLISEIVAEMQLGTKKHLIVADLKAAKKIIADKERIGQVLNNLISNAIKYSPHSDKVIVKSKSTEENITVCVQDFGIGISVDMQKKIFDRFFRLHDKRHPYPGLGLGLYIASEIVKHHKGSLTVKSEPGKGSVFCFTLPIKYSPLSRIR